MRRVLIGIVVLCALGAVASYAITMPRTLGQEVLAAMPAGDAALGETYFWAGGCASCHAAKGAKGEDRLKLGGGRVLATEFGDFVVPNISMHPADGIGDWQADDFANAMLRGISPDGRHYYPSFPYTSFARMEVGDVADLWAYLRTLPQVAGRTADHTLAFPYNLRRGIGLWKWAYLSDAPVIEVDATDPQVARGQYLVEGPGHCAECHTPRDASGGLDPSRWLAGAKAPEGDGRIPNITGGEGGIGGWSVADISYFFESGFTPDYDSVGGSMVEVQENLAMLDPADREAIAAYLQAVPDQPTTE